MMSEYKNIPITAATKILEEYEKDEVIIIAWDGKQNRVHITTDGSNEEHKANAAKGSVALTDYLLERGVISERGAPYEDPNGRLIPKGCRHPEQCSRKYSMEFAYYLCGKCDMYDI